MKISVRCNKSYIKSFFFGVQIFKYIQGDGFLFLSSHCENSINVGKLMDNMLSNETICKISFVGSSIMLTQLARVTEKI